MARCKALTRSAVKGLNQTWHTLHNCSSNYCHTNVVHMLDALILWLLHNTGKGTFLEAFVDKPLGNIGLGLLRPIHIFRYITTVLQHSRQDSTLCI